LFCFCNDRGRLNAKSHVFCDVRGGPLAENYRLFIVAFEAADKTGFGRR
jgi:hypothetical protein